MTKAKDLEEVYSNFEGNLPLDEENNEFFVDIYDKKLKRFIEEIKRNKNYKEISFIAGQIGSGKSTILNHIINTFDDFYNIIQFEPSEISYYQDKGYVDILFMCCSNLVENNNLSKSKKEKFKNRFKDIGFDKIDIKTNLSTDMINELFKFYKELSNDGKEILLVIDVFDETLKIKQNISILKDINCFKIITIPIYLKDIVIIHDGNILDLDILDNKLLKKIIIKRVENQSLIDDDALDLIIKTSKGNIRQLLNIVQKSALEALAITKSERIRVKEVYDVIEELPDFINKSDNTTYIDIIDIKDYFSIQNIKIGDLKEKKEIYFVGENGDGKTILLQAIALANKDPKEYPLLANKYLKGLENKYKIEVLNNPNNYKNNIFDSDIFAYGINRNKYANDIDVDSSGYSGLFDTPSINQTTYLNYPLKLLLKNDEIIENFKKQIINLLHNKIDIKIENSEVVFYENGSKIIFDMLSEGYKSTIIWLCDLFARLYQKNPNTRDTNEFQSVVLIDEIDLYLHPKWKYDFVYKLRQIFPNIQFIMTTHSTATILGASEGAVFYNVYKDENGITNISNPIQDLSDYSANILATSPLFNMQSAKSRTYNSNNEFSEKEYAKNEEQKLIKNELSSDKYDDIRKKILKEL